MTTTEDFKEVLEEEIGTGWRTETDTRTLKVFVGGPQDRFRVEVEVEDGEYLFIMEDSVMSADSMSEQVKQDVALQIFRGFVSGFADSVTKN